MSLEPKQITGGQRLQNIIESLRLPIITENGVSFTVRRFVFYCVKDTPEFARVERDVLRVEQLQRLGFTPVPFPEKMLLRFPECAAWIIQAYIMMAKEIERWK